MGASDRGPSVTWRSFGAAGGLLAILGVGLAFRLIIAYVLLPGSGFGTDRASFIGWAEDLAAHGLYGFYGRVSFIDYTPGYLYVLWLLGIVGNALGGLGDLIKLPAILSDIVVAYLVHQLVLELGGSRRAALIGALIFVVNPVTWFDSAVWAQVDSFGLIFVLLGLRELWRDHPESAAILATIAAVIKPQLGILIPILVAVLIRRYLIDWWQARQAGPTAAAGTVGDATEPRPAGPASSATGGGLFGRLGRGPARIVTAGLAGLVTAAVLCAPFGLTVIDLLVQVGKTAAGYPYITVNAFNPWALIEQAGNGLAANGTWLPDIANSVATGSPVTILGIPALFIGTILLLAVILLVCVVVARHDDRRTILVGVTVLAIAFFVVPTRVHERYLFPFFAFGAILAATSYRWRVAYLALVLANFANLYAVLTNPFYNNPGVSDWLGIGDALRSPLGVTIAALTHLVVGLWALTELRRSATSRLDAETAAGLADELAADELAAHGLAPHGLAANEPAAQELAPDLAAAEAANQVGQAQPSPGALVATTFAAGSAGGPAIALAQPGVGPPLAAFSAGPIGWAARPAPDPVIEGPPITTPAVDYESDRGFLRNMFDRRPRLADRSRSLWGEPGGRFDKLDAFIMVVLLIGLLLLRLFRLDAPMEFHFDEVYHARTAMEFLQGWNYGIPHDIYEYTHPHLAKYAIAEGIQYLGDNEVTATAELGGAGPGDPGRATLGRRHAAPEPGGRSVLRRRRRRRPGVRPPDPGPDRDLLPARCPGPGPRPDEPQGLRRDRQRRDRHDRHDRGARPATNVEPAAGARLGTTLPALANLGVGINLLWVSDDGTVLVAGTAASNTVPVDPATGALGPSLHVDGLADLAAAGSVDGLVVTPSAIKDPTAEANVIAGITGQDAAPIEARLKAIANQAGDNALPVLGSFPADKVQAITNGLSGAIGDGRLLGYQVSPLPQVAAAGSAGVTFIAATTGEKIGLVALDAPATGLADVLADTPNLYVARDGQADRGHPDRRFGHDRAPPVRPAVDLRDARRGQQADLQRDDEDGPRPRPDPRRVVGDDLCRRHHRESTLERDLRRRKAALQPGLVGPGRHPRLPGQRPGGDPDRLAQRRDCLGGRRRKSVRLALPGGGGRRPDRGPDVPPGPDPVPPALDRDPGRSARGDGRDVLRPVPDRDERRLLRPVHRGRLRGLRGPLDRLVALALGLARGPAPGRAPARPGPGQQVGRPVRDRRGGDPDPGPIGPRPDHPDPGPDRGHSRPGQRRPDGGPGQRHDERPELLLRGRHGRVDPGRGPPRGPPAGRLDRRRDAPGDRRPGDPGHPGLPRRGRGRHRHDQLHPGLDQRRPGRGCLRVDRRLGRRLPHLPARRLVRDGSPGGPARSVRPAQPG